MFSCSSYGILETVVTIVNVHKGSLTGLAGLESREVVAENTPLDGTLFLRYHVPDLTVP